MDIIATLHDFVPLQFGGGGAFNEVDVAVASPQPQWFDNVAPFVLQVGEVRGLRNSLLGLIVKKMGRTTRFTRGQITGLNVTIDVGYNGQVARFRNQLQIRGLTPGSPYSLAGDSGSLILDEDNFAVALLFAGSRDGRVTFANPINSVIQALRARPGLQNLNLWQFAW